MFIKHIRCGALNEEFLFLWHWANNQMQRCDEETFCIFAESKEISAQNSLCEMFLFCPQVHGYLRAVLPQSNNKASFYQ